MDESARRSETTGKSECTLSLFYCLSKTVTPLIGFPPASVTLSVMVVNFPSLETTLRDIPISFPPFNHVVVYVLASTRLLAYISAPAGTTDPVIGVGLPSRLVVYEYENLLPSAEVPSKVTFKPLPCDTLQQNPHVKTTCGAPEKAKADPSSRLRPDS
jgi:hypothetical protein